jgi:transcription antitermination factor NusG
MAQLCMLKDSWYRGCFFCRTGKEAEVVRRFISEFPDSRAIFPTCTHYRRTRDEAVEERVPLLPGYVFFEVKATEAAVSQPPNGDCAGRPEWDEGALIAFSGAAHVLKLLRYSNQDWRLHGADDAFAKVLFEAGGNIDTSRAYFDEGDRIRIQSGFLKDYEGSITRVNRKKRIVEVVVDFQDKRVNMKLGYELVAAVENQA